MTKPIVNKIFEEYNKLKMTIVKYKEKLKFPERLQFLNVNPNLTISDFGRQGLHLNKQGKEKLAKLIAEALNNFRVGDQAPPFLNPEDF